MESSLLTADAKYLISRKNIHSVDRPYVSDIKENLYIFYQICKNRRTLDLGLTSELTNFIWLDRYGKNYYDGKECGFKEGLFDPSLRCQLELFEMLKIITFRRMDNKEHTYLQFDAYEYIHKNEIKAIRPFRKKYLENLVKVLYPKNKKEDLKEKIKFNTQIGYTGAFLGCWSLKRKVSLKRIKSLMLAICCEWKDGVKKISDIQEELKKGRKDLLKEYFPKGGFIKYGIKKNNDVNIRAEGYDLKVLKRMLRMGKEPGWYSPERY